MRALWPIVPKELRVHKCNHTHTYNTHTREHLVVGEGGGVAIIPPLPPPLENLVSNKLT